jgi:hypothetical protein
MRRRNAGLALATPFVLLAAACGSQQPAKFHPAGSTVPAAASAPAAVAVPVPFPGKVSFRFGPLPASSPDATAAAARDRNFLLAYYYAIYTRGQSKSYTSYIGNNGVLRTVQNSVAQHVAGHQGLVGVDRHARTTVTPNAYYPGDLDVNYCVNEAGLKYTDIRTGRVVGNGSAPGQLYYLESDTFAKDSHGTWQLVGILTTPYPKGRARECKP